MSCCYHYRNKASLQLFNNEGKTSFFCLFFLRLKNTFKLYPYIDIVIYLKYICIYSAKPLHDCSKISSAQKKKFHSYSISVEKHEQNWWSDRARKKEELCRLSTCFPFLQRIYACYEVLEKKSGKRRIEAAEYIFFTWLMCYWDGDLFRCALIKCMFT